MTLKHQIGQMLVLGFRGLSIDRNHPFVKDLKAYHIGGVLLFSKDIALKTDQRNIASKPQVRRLIEQLKDCSPEPLFVCVDQEGGRVARFEKRFGFPTFPSAMDLGRQGDIDITFHHAFQMAEMVSTLGVNMNFAPVVDMNRNPLNPVIGALERSYSHDAADVAAHAGAFIEAHHENRVLCTVKHFPGHGSALKDSHLDFVDVTATWSEDEMLPFKNLIQRDLVDAVMTAHIFHREIDPYFPATLSRAFIQERLRNQMGYDGVVITDDIQMAAVHQSYDLPTILAQTLMAGVDMIIIGNNLSYDEHIATKCIDIIVDLVEQGTVPRKRIEESHARIMRLKKTFNNGSSKKDKGDHADDHHELSAGSSKVRNSTV